MRIRKMCFFSEVFKMNQSQCYKLNTRKTRENTILHIKKLCLNEAGQACNSSFLGNIQVGGLRSEVDLGKKPETLPAEKLKQKVLEFDSSGKAPAQQV